MDTNELKAIVARHYCYAENGQGQFFHGDWMTAKTKDSLQFLVDEFNAELEKAEDDYEKLQDEVDSLNSEINTLKEDMRELEKETGAV